MHAHSAVLRVQSVGTSKHIAGLEVPGVGFIEYTGLKWEN
jgi:hypothetical protein